MPLHSRTLPASFRLIVGRRRMVSTFEPLSAAAPARDRAPRQDRLWLSVARQVRVQGDGDPLTPSAAAGSSGVESEFHILGAGDRWAF